MPRLPAETIKQLKDSIDLRELASQFTELRGGREQYGPCPRCGGIDRFHVDKSRFFCRNCLPPESGGGNHDVLDFLVFVKRAPNFKAAYEQLTGLMPSLPSPVRPRSVRSKPSINYATPAWQSHVRQEITAGHTLLCAESGALGQAYLTRRGLLPQTWHMAQLGLTARIDAEGRKGWAIAIPWQYQGVFTAIQYRFLDERAQRYTRYQYAGYYGETVLFTLPSKGSSHLVICEGEINALSVWQASAYDSISIGSQCMAPHTLEALRRYVADYKQIQIWTDEWQVATRLVEAFSGRGEVLTNPDGDANELLQQDRLAQLFA
jgi:hypothetical protein